MRRKRKARDAEPVDAQLVDVVHGERQDRLEAVLRGEFIVWEDAPSAGRTDGAVSQSLVAVRKPETNALFKDLRRE